MRYTNERTLLVTPRRVNTSHIRHVDNNPFSGARGLDIHLARESFTTPKAPVPYYEYWDCPWKQTAQQCVAIISMLQQELKK